MAGIPLRAEAPAEPLAESAPLASRLASEFCGGNAFDAGSCAWYHGAWQWLRLLNLIDNPQLDGEFLARALVPASSRFRVLISGSADYGTLAKLLSVAGQAALDITVIDACRTPLELNLWYARRAGKEIAVEQADVFSYSPREPFDLVLAHSFLLHFPAVRRAAVIARWRELLRPGGHVVTANRVWPAGTPEIVRFSAQQVQAFRGAAHAAAQALDRQTALSPAQLAELAESYARNRALHSVTSAQELQSAFTGAGFALEQFEMGEAALATRARVDGITQRARIRARRL